MADVEAVGGGLGEKSGGNVPGGGVMTEAVGVASTAVTVTEPCILSGWNEQRYIHRPTSSNTWPNASPGPIVPLSKLSCWTTL